ncbi:MAG: ParA family protein, partial [Rhodothermales bacterium]|nr:ParA family protein [Rhodothermales bacterium]
GMSEPSNGTSSLSLFDPDCRLTGSTGHALRWFDVLPASSRAPKFLRQLSKATDVLWVRESLRESDLGYELVIIDTAAAVTAYSLAALVAADLVVIPVAPEYQPVIGGEQCYATIRTVQSRLNPGMLKPRFAFTQVDARKRSHHDYRSYLRQKYGDSVMRREVRTSAALSHSYQDGTTVFDHDPGSRGAVDYANLTDEVLRILSEAAARTEVLVLNQEEVSNVAG